MPFESVAAHQALTLTIAQMSQRTGLSPDTLRYYERAGLIERVGRNTGNQRRYDDRDVAWVAFLLRLRETGMSISDMQRYAHLRAEGASTVDERLGMLRGHRSDLAEQIRRLQQNAKALDKKIGHYQQLLAEQQETDEP